MVQIIRLILIGVMVAITVSWLNQQSGQSQIQWLGYQLEVSTSLLVSLVILLAVIVLLFDRLWRLIRNWPKMMAHGWQYRRRTNGERALGLGLVALAAGDSRSAQKQARKAEKLLGKGLLPDLLAAQAAHLAGDKNAARQYFAQLSKHKDTAYYGFIGLMNLQIQNNNSERSLAAAQKALQLQPDSITALTHIFSQEISQKNWKKALNTLSLMKPQKANLQEQKHLFLNREIALCYLSAQDTPDDKGKITWLERAIKLDASHIACRVMLARLYQKSDAKKQMIKIVERGFILKPHQDYFEILRETYQDNIGSFIARVTKLARQSENKLDANRVVVAASLDAGILPTATSLLSEIPQPEMTNEDYLLAAELAEKRLDPGAVKKALQEAARAPRGKSWRCFACSTVVAQYEPVCPKCNDVGTIDWLQESPIILKSINDDKLLANNLNKRN